MSRSRRGAGTLAVGVGLVLASCTPGGPVSDRSTASDDATIAAPTTVAEADRPAAVGGERRVATVADAPDGDVILDAEPVRVQLADVPRWIVGVPGPDGSAVLVVVTETDGVHAFEVAPSGDVTRVTPPRPRTDWHRPPVLLAADGSLELVLPPDDASRDAPVLPLAAGGLAYVGADGDLVVTSGDGEAQRYPLDLLPDGWLVPVEGDRLAALASPTDAYGHGVLGDAIEAAEVVVVDVTSGRVETRIEVDGVVEGLRPDIGRIAGLDEPVLVVTVSDDEGGADVVAYGLDGRVLSTTGPIGTGNRWRHVIALDEEVGLVEVVTPHLGKELRIVRAEGDRLAPAVTLPGVMSSHAIGSRGLDEAKLLHVGGRDAVVGPGPDRRTLVALAAGDGSVLTEHGLPARWGSNLAAVRHAGGTLVAVGTEDGSVLVWPASG